MGRLHIDCNGWQCNGRGIELRAFAVLDLQEISMRQQVSRPALVAGAALLLMVTGGCSRIREHQGFLMDKLIVDSVLPGIDNKASVEGAMGRPTFTSQFGPERWYYVSRQTKQLAFGAPKPIEQVLITVQFDPGGNVATIDRDSSMAQLAKINPTGAKTATLGRKRSLFDEIFGNIGAVGAGPGGGQMGPSGPGPNGS
jgi:outer membrane protein assembly factor BamE (lipoprotein component of BamABCDE complex)